MSFRTLAEALLSGRPYFGPALCAMQGAPERHRYFLPVVTGMARRREGRHLDILEIGSWAGASTVSWALALRETGAVGTVTCVDPWAPYFDVESERARHYLDMDSAARDGLVALLFEHNIRSAGVAGMVRQLRGYSQNVLPELPGGQFDIVYIDGSHRFEDVCFDIREAKRLLRDDGVICGDDLEIEAGALPAGELAQAIASGRDYLSSATPGSHYHPGVTGAVAQEFRAVGVWEGFWAAQPRDGEWAAPGLDVDALRLPVHIDRRQGQVRLVDSTETHNIIESDGAYFAVHKSLGPVDLFHEQLGDREMAPLLLTGATLDEVRRKSEQGRPAAAPEPEVPVQAGSYREFNLVAYQGRAFALRMSLGPVDVTQGEDALRQRFSPEDFLVGADAATARSVIDHIELIRTGADTTAQLARNISDLAAEIEKLRVSPDAESELRSHLASETAARQSQCAEFTDMLQTRRLELLAGSAELRGKLETYRQEYLADSTELHDALQMNRDEFASDSGEVRDLLASHRRELHAVSTELRDALETKHREFLSDWKAAAVQLEQDLRAQSRDTLDEAAARIHALSRKQDLLGHQMALIQYGPGNPDTPCPAGEHLGFHLIYYRGRVYALRKPLDLDDLKRGEQELMAVCGPDDVIAGDAVDSVRARVEVVEGLRELRAGIAALDREFMAHRAEMSEGLKQLDAVAREHTRDPDKPGRRWQSRISKD